MSLPDPSEEQQVIIDTACDLGNNIMVDAVAGSGKTTLCMHIAERLRTEQNGARMLIITYNKDLKAESRARAESLGLTNVEVHTYHSLCYRYYGSQDYTDEGIKNSIALAHLSGYSSTSPFRLIVLDESQDVTDLLFQLFRRFYSDIRGRDTGIPIMLIGDKYQTIYGFKGADARYLTQASEKYAVNELPWTSLEMHTSFRITHEIAEFVNHAMLGMDRMIAAKPGPKVIYERTDVFRAASIATHLHGYRDDEIMLLSPSIKSAKVPVRVLANYLSMGGRRIYAPVSDDSTPDRRDMNGKVAVLTFHQSKGLERRVVIVFNFDASYFEYFNIHDDPSVCPNVMYVACTRAKEKLVLLHQRDQVKKRQNTTTVVSPLPFLNVDAVNDLCEVHGIIGAAQTVTRGLRDKFSVTQLCSHLTNDHLADMRSHYETEHIENVGAWDTINVKDVIYTKFTEPKRIETVSEITGTAVPLMFAYLSRGSLVKVLSGCERLIPDAEETSDRDSRLDYILAHVPLFLEQANIYIAYVSGYIHKVNQINSYNWMTPGDAREALQRLGAQISEDARFETRRTYTRMVDGELQYKILGITDCIDDDILWEFKFTSSLQAEHVIQLALYALLTGCSYTEYRLFNVKTGEMLRLVDPDPDVLQEMADKLVDIKISDIPVLDETEFMRKKKLPKRPPPALQSDLDALNDL